MHDIRITTIVVSIATLALGTHCTLDEGAGFDDETADEGAETLDDGATDEDDVEFRTYEGVIANPWYGTQIRTGTTVGKTHEFSPTCAYSNNAKDVSYTWTAPTTASFTFTTAGSAYDTVLHVRPFANSAQTLACNDDSNGTLQSSVTLNITQGTTVIIVVDGYSSNTGTFKLNISKANPCPGGCSTAPTQCHVPNGTCMIDPFNGSGSCYHPFVFGGTVCDDGLECTPSSSCYSGSCVPDGYNPATVCDDPPGDCYEPVGACILPSGNCTYAPKAAGSSCSGSNPCGHLGTCNGAGVCNDGPGFCPLGTTCTGHGCQSNCWPLDQAQLDPDQLDPGESEAAIPSDGGVQPLQPVPICPEVY